MNKINLIIGREYMTKIKSRTFILLTILGPILYLLLIFGSVFIAKLANKGDVDLVLVDKSGLFADDFKKESKFITQIQNLDPEEIERAYMEEGWESTTVYIPANIAETKKGVEIYYKENPGMSVVDKVKNIVNNKLRDVAMLNEGIDKAVAQSIQSIDVEVETKPISEEGAKQGNVKIAAGLAFGSAFLLYFFIFIYGSMVLRGVQEEKTSRISEVIISSVKPFELMMGKIIGNALLGFTQFAFWIILATAGSMVVGAIFADSTQGMLQEMTQNNPQMQAGMASNPMAQDSISALMQAGADFNVFETIFYFIIFFLGGYLLYSSLFAAVAAAVDGQQDLQQFMLPISLPLILGIIVMPSVIENPNNPLAVFFSIFPLTSPIVMMARIPFEVVWWQKLLSVVLLIATFIGSVYVSGKIYRVGLLSYGAKPSWKQMFKWLTYKG
ncbi:ABC transporter permease [bacterium]|nr:ABC transporter permease [bacterium]